MRQAIVTKYLGPTNHRGARVKATCQAGSLTLPWDDAMDVGDNHCDVAHRLATKLEWLSGCKLVGGAMPDGSGYCFVLVPEVK